MNADEHTETKRKANARGERKEKGLLFLRESTLHEEIWPDRGVDMLVCAAEGNRKVLCAKLYMGFSIAVKFSVFTWLFVVCVCSEFSGSVDK